MKHFKRSLVLCWSASLALAAAADAAVKVVATQETYASLAREIGGDRISAESIVPGAADAHFVKPKPSYAVMLRDADLFISTGLDLELWAPVLVNKAGNRKIADGAVGYVAAAHGVELLEKPTSLDRSAGDVHIYGNPHIQTSPINIAIVAGNIATGLCKVDPDGCDLYRTSLADFKDRLARRLYGDTLVEMIGVESLDALAQNGRLLGFLEERGQKDAIGGWLAEAMPFRGRTLVCYHKNWIYFTTLFGLNVMDYVEPKPGIPPTARHVAELIESIASQRVGVLLAANYFERSKPQLIADRTGILPVVVPMSVGGEPGVDSYFDLVDLWIGRLREAFARAYGSRTPAVADRHGDAHQGHRTEHHGR